MKYSIFKYNIVYSPKHIIKKHPYSSKNEIFLLFSYI